MADVGWEPWPPPRGRSAALDLVVTCYPAIAGELVAEAARAVFAPDLIVTPTPELVEGAYRPFFGIDGLVEWSAEVGRRFPGMVAHADAYRVRGQQVAVRGRLVLGDERWVSSAWLWTVAGGRVRALRAFRHAAEALSRLEAGPGD